MGHSPGYPTTPRKKGYYESESYIDKTKIGRSLVHCGLLCLENCSLQNITNGTAKAHNRVAKDFRRLTTISNEK
jgi:hypothetical protein